MLLGLTVGAMLFEFIVLLAGCGVFPLDGAMLFGFTTGFIVVPLAGGVLGTDPGGGRGWRGGSGWSGGKGCSPGVAPGVVVPGVVPGAGVD
jgi:hypothetical protein